MTTASQARAAVRARMEAGGITYNGAAVPMRWPNEAGDPLPDEPAPFVYTEFMVERAEVAGFGGGRAANLHRNTCRIEGYVFVPKGWGLDASEDIAEQIATLFRSHRDATISCFSARVSPGGDGADLKPVGLPSPVSNYFWCGFDVALHFDQTG